MNSVAGNHSRIFIKTMMICFLLGSALAYLLLMAVYRLRLHPLSKFPGPRLAAMTGLYEVYFAAWGNQSFETEIHNMHQQYGEKDLLPSISLPCLRATADTLARPGRPHQSRRNPRRRAVPRRGLRRLLDQRNPWSRHWLPLQTRLSAAHYAGTLALQSALFDPGGRPAYPQGSGAATPSTSRTQLEASTAASSAVSQRGSSTASEEQQSRERDPSQCLAETQAPIYFQTAFNSTCGLEECSTPKPAAG